jgi:hypothetical protein
MNQIYIDFFDFLKGIIDPVLPESFKSSEFYTNLNKEVPAFLKTVKGFAYVNAIIGEMCKKESTRNSIKNIASVTEDEQKLHASVAEIKTLAALISEQCNKVTSLTDAELAENIETFSLYIEMITKQFIKK